MLSWLIRFSVQRKAVVIALALVLMGYGIFQLFHAGLDIFPEFSPKQVIIQTEAPGYSAEQVETLVTRPLEAALSGLIGIDRIRSESIQGLSIITVIFAENSDIFRNRQLVSERLASTASILPAGIGPAEPVPLSSSSATILTIGLTSDKHDLLELRKIVDYTLVPRILSVPGVADVNIFGGQQKQLQIQVDPEKLSSLGLGLNDVSAALQQFNSNLGSGFIETRNQRMTLQIRSPVSSVETLKRIALKPQSGNPQAALTLADVAEIKEAAAPAFGAAQVNGQPGIVMMIIGQYQANTLAVSRDTEKLLREFDQLFEKQQISFYPSLFRPADYILTSVNNLSGHLLVGGLFVLIILYLFLFNIRTAIISALAIPLSLISAVIVLLAMGINLNIMILGGLAIALGEVVDDAIIDTENIFRRLREAHEKQSLRSIAQIVIDASIEVRGSVVYASFIVALVFVPLLTLGGVAGRLFSPLGFSYILAILMSLLVAVTVTPALCYLLLPGITKRQHSSEPPLIRWMKPLYGRWLTLSSKIPATLLVLIIASTTAAAGILTQLGGQFLPELREGHYIVHTTSLPGTSLEESIRMGKRLIEEIRKIEGVISVSQWAGRAERGADTYGSHYSEYEVRLEPLDGQGQQHILDQIRAILGRFPGLLFEANTFLTERVDETISGYTSPVVINVYGNDLDRLDKKAQEIATVVQQIDGAESVQLRAPTGTAQIDIYLRYDRLSYWGLQPNDVQQVVQTAYEGNVVASTIDHDHMVDISVVLAPELRSKANYLDQLPIKTPGGTLISLSEVAHVQQTEGRYNILHQGGQRLQTITADVDDRDLASFMEELKQAIHQNVSFPADMFPEFTGAAVEQATAKQQLLIHSLLAGSGVLILIYMALGSFRHTWITLANIPFSLIGGLIAINLSGADLSIGSMVGFVTLFGITVRNSIMLVSHYNHLVQYENAVWNIETMVRGAQERLPSILMTALVTALAMLPIAIDSDNPGREIMGPMATIIIGGLISSTLLNLVLLPLLLLKYGHFSASEDATQNH